MFSVHQDCHRWNASFLLSIYTFKTYSFAELIFFNTRYPHPHPPPTPPHPSKRRAVWHPLSCKVILRSLTHFTLHGFLFPQLSSPPYLYSSFAFSSPVCHPPPLLSLLKFLHFSAPYFLGGGELWKAWKEKTLYFGTDHFLLPLLFFSFSREFTPRTDATKLPVLIPEAIDPSRTGKGKRLFSFIFLGKHSLSLCLSVMVDPKGKIRRRGELWWSAPVMAGTSVLHKKGRGEIKCV